VPQAYTPQNQGRIKGEKWVELTGAPRRHRNNSKYDAVKLSLPHVKKKKASQNYQQFGHERSKNVRQPCPWPKRLKEYLFEEPPH
jgi:hypothetical protein